MLEYRRDIDGLRAVAVLPVVIFHLAQSYLGGGYIGVDVFFVISGYLISSKLLADSATGQPFAKRFWMGRLRRIGPAYLVMLAVTSAVCFTCYYPSELREYGRQLTASIASISNIYLWLTIGYFNPAGEIFPLLHTWSLSVEEQFYLIFPVILIIFRPRPRKIQFGVLFLFAASLLASVYTAHSAPTFAFYMIATRAWELLLGTLLACNVLPPMKSQAAAELAGALGLAGICFSAVLYTPAMTGFPGYLALPPCLGAAAIIQSGRDHRTAVSRLLSAQPIVFFGLISYSLYLWHWPLIAFQKTSQLLIATESKAIERSFVLLVSIVVATISWALIERPSRNPARFGDRRLLTWCGGAAALLLATCIAISATKGFPARFSQRSNAIARYLDYDFNSAMRVGICHLSEDMPLSRLDKAACMPTAPGRKTYLLVGDSHAAAIAAGLRRAFPDANIWQITGAACLPVIGSQPSVAAGAKACKSLMDLALVELPIKRHLDGVWLFGRFGAGNVEATTQALQATAHHLERHGVVPVIIGPNPEWRISVPRLLARSMDEQAPRLSHSYLAPEPQAAEEVLRPAMQRARIRYASLLDVLCSKGDCKTSDDHGVPLLFDKDHFTIEGGLYIAERIRPFLIPAPPAISSQRQNLNSGPTQAPSTREP